MNRELFQITISILAAIVLFLFSLKGFSKELQEVGAERLKIWLSKVTGNKFYGFLVGVLATALIQSSSAVSSIIVALVDAGVISFYNSFGVLIGTNVGTTFTAWLVALKLDDLGSILIVLGTLISVVPNKINLIGKSIFYLGFILFALRLISFSIAPLKEAPIFVEMLQYSDSIAIGILLGAILTTILQSSSVVTGLVIILASQSLVTLDGAIAVLLGANLGTSSTAILASINMSEAAKKSAKATLYFNFIGVLLFLPFFGMFANFIGSFDVDLTYKIAIAHLIFNLIIAMIFLTFSKAIYMWLFKGKD
ncbi:Na/Pi symporter [Riemerella anatipestifer]|nr:Na/Pi symporter [Riemerella anatipestifer]